MRRHGRAGSGRSPRWGSATIGAAATALVLAVPPTAHGLAGTIEQQAYLKASTASSRFGGSVAVDGDTIVVGAPLEDAFAGAVHVFVRDGGAWSHQARLVPDAPGAQFGHAVDVSGDTVVVGDFDRGTGGAAVVFVRSGTSWIQQAAIEPPDADASDLFGNDVAIDGDTLVVGAPNEDSNGTGTADDTATDSGAAFVFTRSGTTWSLQAHLKPTVVGAGDWFGTAVDLDGDTIVVGSPFEDSDGTSASNDLARQSGAAHVFTRSGTAWAQQALLKASNVGDADDTDIAGDEFGTSVAVHGDTVVVGAPKEDSDGVVPDAASDESASDAGAAYVFARSGTTWSEQAYLKASDVDAGDEFGVSVAVHGDTVVVGARSEDSGATGVDGDDADDAALGAGSAYLYARSGATWSRRAYLKASNTGAQDAFGHAVALDAASVVVGANLEDSAARGVDGDEDDDSASGAGAVYVFAAAADPGGRSASPTGGPRLTVEPGTIASGGTVTGSVSGADPGVAFLWRLSDGAGATLAEGDVTVDASGSGEFVVRPPSGVTGPLTLELVAWEVRAEVTVSGPVPALVPAGGGSAPRIPTGVVLLLIAASLLVLSPAGRSRARS